MWRDLCLVAAKDLRIELRSRVASGQILPFALVVLILFGFTLDADRTVLERAAPGLFWMTVLFASVVAVHRSAAVETADGARRGLLLAGIEPMSVFAGKSAAIAVQLLAVEIPLTAGIVVLYGAEIEAWGLLAVTCVAAALAIAVTGSLLGALVAGLRAQETVLPILLFPVLAPVLIAASRAFDDALGTAAVDGWAWLGLLAGFGALNATFGAWAYGVLLEET